MTKNIVLHSTQLFLILLVVLLIVPRSFAEECPWSYDTPNQWSKLCNGEYKICELGHRQSPVAIDSKKLKPAPATFKPLSISYGQIHHTHVEFYDGIIHLLEAGARHTIKGGPLDEEYVLRQFHFHTPGEHSLDSLVSALEVHFVHFSPDNSSIAVLSVRFRERNRGQNAAWLDQVLSVRAIKRIMEGIDALPPSTGGLTPSTGIDADGDGVVDEIPLIDIVSLLPVQHNYLYYYGSLTTPPCTENVHWFLLESYSEIEFSQIRKLTVARNRDPKPRPQNRYSHLFWCSFQWEGLNNRPMSENFEGEVFRYDENLVHIVEDDVDRSTYDTKIWHHGITVGIVILGLVCIVSIFGFFYYRYQKKITAEISEMISPDHIGLQVIDTAVHDSNPIDIRV